MYIQVKVVGNNIFTIDGKFIGTKGMNWSFLNRFEVMTDKCDKTAFYGFVDSNGNFHELCKQTICRPNSCPMFGKKDCRYSKAVQNISGYYILDD